MLLIYQIPLGAGMLVICPMPGRLGAYKAYLKHLVDWRPNLVLTMAPLAELQRAGASTFPDDLAQAGIQWLQRPIVDFGTPFDGDMPLWSAILEVAHRVLSEKGCTFVYCYGGCRRSGMALLRLMCEVGEAADYALERLRALAQ